jgi:hypothetical protein
MLSVQLSSFFALSRIADPWISNLKKSESGLWSSGRPIFGKKTCEIVSISEPFLTV